MKLVLSLLSFFLMAFSATGQSNDSVMEKLLDYGLIEKKQVKSFNDYLQNKNTITSSSYLNALLQEEYKKTLGPNYSSITYVSFADDSLDSIKKGARNKQFKEYLNKLKACELINEQQLFKIEAKISKNEFLHKIQLISGALRQVAHEEYMNVADLKSFAEKLKRNEMVTDQYNQLISDIENGKIENSIDFLKYSPTAVLIRKTDYSKTPEDYLEKIHKKTADLLPELSFTDFKFQIIEDSMNSGSDNKSYNFLVSLASNGRIYSQKSFYRLYSVNKNEYYGDGIDQQEYYKIFNKILSDLHSPFRLHEVKRSNDHGDSNEEFGIIALTKEQAEFLHGGGVYFSPSYENFEGRMTSESIENAIREFKKIKLLSHLSQQQIEEARQRVFERENTNLNDVILSFPDVVHSFDMELANLEDPYAELVRALAIISHGDFNARDISDNFDIEKRKKVTLKFTLGSRDYEKTFKIQDDWIDVDVFKFIDEVAKENGLKGKFYHLFEGGQGTHMIYLYPEQFQYLEENKLLVF